VIVFDVYYRKWFWRRCRGGADASAAVDGCAPDHRYDRLSLQHINVDGTTVGPVSSSVFTAAGRPPPAAATGAPPADQR